MENDKIMKRFKFIKNIAWGGVFLLAACSDFLKEKSPGRGDRDDRV